MIRSVWLDRYGLIEHTLSLTLILSLSIVGKITLSSEI